MCESSVQYNTILGLNRQHLHIANLFNLHQKLLMHGDVDQAIGKLKEFTQYVKSHMKAEDDYLLPLYEKYISPKPIGGAVEFFMHEHHKITRFVGDLTATSVSCTDHSKIQKIDLVNLFDQHYKFKHLLDHHHTREDTFLFRLLDTVLKDEIKEEVLKHFTFDYK